MVSRGTREDKAKERELTMVNTVLIIMVKVNCISRPDVNYS